MPTNDLVSPLEDAQEITSLVDVMEAEGDIDETLAEEVRQESAALQQKWESSLEALGGKLESKFREYSGRRSIKEGEWMSAILQHQGYRGHIPDKGKLHHQQYPGKKIPPKSNVTRQKVNAAVHRLEDIQFPVGGDYNFEMDIIPLPELEQAVADQRPIGPSPVPGQAPEQGPAEGPEQAAPTVGDVAVAQINQEKDKASRMELLIKEQFTRSKYGRVARDTMRDWALLGTGVIKGPVVEIDSIKTYENIPDSLGGVQSSLDVNHEEYPAATRVDLRYFYPDPDALEPDDIEDSFELHPMTKKQVRDLINNPAYMEDQARKLLELEPDGTTGDHAINMIHLFDTDATLKNRYMVKEYHGSIDKEVLWMMGEITEEQKDDLLFQPFGEVWHCKGIVLRVGLSTVEGTDKIPYHIVRWEKDDSSLFGHGMAYMMQDAQRVINSTWQMILDNAGLSAGPQIVINKDLIEPANGNWTLEPMKIWYHTEYGNDVRNAFQFADVPNNQGELASVVEMAMQFADLESASPMLQMQNLPQGNNTAAGMGMIMTTANVTQRALSQDWDDNITVPLVNGFYHYNMQYMDDPMIKGNFQVVIGGATEKIDNQILAQDIERILAVASQNPDYALQLDAGAAFRRWASATRAGHEILKSSEEVEREIQRMQEEQANQPPPAENIRAEASMLREQTRQQELQFNQQLEQFKAQAEQEKIQAERELAMQEARNKEIELQLKLQMKQLDVQLAVMELAHKEDKTVAEITSQLDLAEMKNTTELIKKEMDLEKFEREAALKDRFGTGV